MGALLTIAVIGIFIFAPSFAVFSLAEIINFMAFGWSTLSFCIGVMILFCWISWGERNEAPSTHRNIIDEILD